MLFTFKKLFLLGSSGDFTLLSIKFIILLSVADPRSHPDRLSKRFWIPGPDPHQRIEVFLTKKFVSELSEM